MRTDNGVELFALSWSMPPTLAVWCQLPRSCPTTHSFSLAFFKKPSGFIDGSRKRCIEFTMRPATASVL